MEIIRLTVGQLDANCYLVFAAPEDQAVIIDPGGDASEIIRECEDRELEPRAIVNTHAHADHIGAAAELVEEYPEADLCVGREDAELMGDSVRNLSSMFGLSARLPEPDRLLEEGDEVAFGECSLRVLETPGHTPGSISLVADAPDPKVIFSGDLIFAGGVGRTDLPGGNAEELKRSIREKIWRFPDETLLYSGHGPPTTVGEEKTRGLFG
jgi:glyoxylase-like metal-dependent hydrolase (beta-lactamase superfamily II)